MVIPKCVIGLVAIVNDDLFLIMFGAYLILLWKSLTNFYKSFQTPFFCL